MSIVVIGRNGQLARALAERAAGENLDLHPLARPEIDLARAQTLAPALDRLRPALVINAAAYTAVDQAESEPEIARAINAEAPARLAAWCAGSGAALIHISTDYVFDGEKMGPYLEDDIPLPTSAYGRSKLAGEVAVAATCPRHVIVRTAWVHSPWGRNFVRTMLRLAETRREVSVVDDQVGNPTYAPHLADAVIAMARTVLAGGEPRWGLYHAAGGGRASWCGLAREIFACSGRLGGPSAEVTAIATADYPTPARRPANSTLDCGRLERAFGLRLPDWREGVGECVARVVGTGSAAADAAMENSR